MFERLTEKLNNVFSSMRGKGVISEEDFANAMREIRVALLEADVSLTVVKDLIENVKRKCLGLEVFKSVSPGQMIIKIVNDTLIELLGKENVEINWSSDLTVIMVTGLQGSGKTTTSAKLAYRIKNRNGKRPLLVSLDVYRPAAQQQLKVMAERAGVDSVEIVQGEKPEQITKRALEKAKSGAYEVLILDTAGRLHIDDEMMDELQKIKDMAKPSEILLVADSLTGQDAVNIAQNFNDQLDLTGIVLTRMEGDGRGGAVLSMKHITGCPVKFLGVGEKLEHLDEFHPERIASRILDMGDVVSLVEKAAQTIEKEEAEKIAKKAMDGRFDLDDLANQLKNLKKMGGMGSLLGMLPGMGQIKQALGEVQIDDKIIARQQAIIYSMTPEERRNARIINGSRKRRIAAGSGVTVQDVNKLLKQYTTMSEMMKKMRRMGDKGMLRGGLQSLMAKMG